LKYTSKLIETEWKIIFLDTFKFFKIVSKREITQKVLMNYHYRYQNNPYNLQTITNYYKNKFSNSFHSEL